MKLRHSCFNKILFTIDVDALYLAVDKENVDIVRLLLTDEKVNTLYALNGIRIIVIQFN